MLTDGLGNQPKFLDEVSGLINARTFAIGLGAAQEVSTSALTKLTNGTGGYLSSPTHWAPTPTATPPSSSSACSAAPAFRLERASK
ncbi:hypothetical protein [Streptomyces sp. TN58]|uniref:hypothetical protein n=1 Tax=Streptomyces sp. TN58 TaxID=234612 RepID=UPI000AD05153|nr:hypothetical protein [Streptomyces sp. TN58]